MTLDEQRTARLLFARELAGGDLAPAKLEHPDVRSAARSAAASGRAGRIAQRAAMKLGMLGYERGSLSSYVRARRAVLGEAAFGPPRFLVRVDEFPHAGSFAPGSEHGVEEFEDFHAIMRDGTVSYLLAVLPVVARAYLDPGVGEYRELENAELDMLGLVAREGVLLGHHGFSHRSRSPSPRGRSELSGMNADELSRLLDEGATRLSAIGIEPRVFVPPFNRFDADQYDLLAARYDVVCGGPETVPAVGFRRTPSWLGNAAYVPAYPPLYGRARDVLPVCEELIERQVGTWVPIVIHWGWEARRGWDDLRRLADRIGSYASSWDEFLQAVEASR